MGKRLPTRLLTLALAISPLPASAATLTVLQIEAPEASGKFTPVAFSNARQVVVPVGVDPFGGLRFSSDSGTLTLEPGGHAAQVGAAIYGSAAVGRPAVSSVRLMTSGDFLGRQLTPAGPRPNTVLIAPARLPGGAKLVNASFTGSTGFQGFDADLLRRTDVLVARDRVTVVAGAVTSTSGVNTGQSGAASLLWGARNVIAVRGSSAESVFEPAKATVGRRFADVWGDGTASVATGGVTSMAAALWSEAMTRKRSEIARPAGIRALLMAGADRSPKPAGAPAWQRELLNGLDQDLGAGRVDYTTSRSLLATPKLAFSSPRGSTLRGPFAGVSRPRAVTALSRGVAALTTSARQTLASLFRLDAPATGVTATLAWDTSLRSGSALDLLLELRPVTLTDRGDATLGTPLASLDADGDNLRHLVSGLTFPAGLYAWTVTNQSAERTDAVLAFRFDTGTAPASVASLTTSPPGPVTAPGLVSAPIVSTTVVPEPAAATLLLAAAPLWCRRRRGGR